MAKKAKTKKHAAKPTGRAHRRAPAHHHEHGSHGDHRASSPAGEHRALGPSPDRIGIRVITVSDTRSAADDKSGALLESLFRAAGHEVSRALVQDEREQITRAIHDAESDGSVRAIVLTGGTGIARRDVTADQVRLMLDRELPGFGEIFRALSWEEIGSAAFLSRALAGIRGTRAVFALPGSSAAVRLAAESLIIPELGHLVRELDR